MQKFIKQYPAVFEKNKKGFGIFFPDVVGCISLGNNFNEAYKNAIEALTLHISGMIEDKEEAPIINISKAQREAKNHLLVMIEPDKFLLSKLIRGKSKRISATIDEYILELSDKKLKEHNLNRSKIIEKILLGVATNKIPLEMILEY